MIWSEHDNNFKMLNSELSHQCEKLNAQSISGVLLGGNDVLGPQSSGEMDIDPEDEQKDGQKLGGNQRYSTPQEAARSAAVERMFNAGAPAVSYEGGKMASEQQPINSERTVSKVKMGQTQEIVHHNTMVSDLLRPAAPECSEAQTAHAYSSAQLADVPGTSTGNLSQLAPRMGAPAAHHEEHDIKRKALDISGVELGEMSDSVGLTGPSGFGDHRVLSEGFTSSAVEREPVGYDQLPGMFPTADPAVERAQKVQEAVDSLVSVSGREAVSALETVERIFTNALQNPGVEKFRSVRVNNQAFHKRLGRHPVSIDLMKLVGFVEEGEPLNPVIRLRRQDPGLLWLGLSVVKQSLERLC